MKIINIEVNLVEAGFRNWVFTQIFTDEGITGISETTIKRKALSLKTSIDELSRYLIGKDPTCIEEHIEKMYRDAFWVGGAMLSSSISAVEAAMWDILGKSLNLPVYKLLGGPTRDKLRVYTWLRAPRSAPPEVWAEAARLAQSEGYSAGKVGFSALTQDYDPFVKETEGLSSAVIKEVEKKLTAIREAVGWEFDIAMDIHGRFSAANAIRLIHAIDDLDLMFVEEPLPPENIDAMKRVAESVKTPLATGERFYFRHGYRTLIEKQAAAIIQPDVCNVGGIMEAKKVAAMAEAYYMGVAPHNPNGPVATAMTAHVAASIPNFLIMETSGSEDERLRHAEIVEEPLRVKNGFLELPTKPGLGISLIQDAIKRHPYKIFDGSR